MVGVRKGAWTEEEDLLLRKCIEKYGEGKWHQVPLRAGLNRCRKSCRLRWLNYLRPNIKRGSFSFDEVDLILRLHNLLGNRWSLIAGRLPGRTANDVKNYWNSHLSKKYCAEEGISGKATAQAGTSKGSKNKIVKPRPRTFSKKASSVLRDESPIMISGTENTNEQRIMASSNEDSNIGKEVEEEAAAYSSAPVAVEDVAMQWWETLIAANNEEKDGGEGITMSVTSWSSLLKSTSSGSSERMIPFEGEEEEQRVAAAQDDHGVSSAIEIDIWDLLCSDDV